MTTGLSSEFFLGLAYAAPVAAAMWFVIGVLVWWAA